MVYFFWEIQVIKQYKLNYTILHFKKDVFNQIESYILDKKIVFKNIN